MAGTHGPDADLLVIGGGGLAREILFLVDDCWPTWNVIGVLDDSPDLQDQNTVSGVPVLGSISDWPRYAAAQAVVAIGDPRVRREIVNRLQSYGDPRFATLIHPSAIVARSSKLGDGSIIAAGCIVTTDARIGQHVVLDRGVNVGHDAIISDFCTISPLAPLGGNVKLDSGVWVGAGASVRQGTRMGEGSMAGMGAAVIDDVPPRQLVTGVPARFKRELPPLQ